MHAHNHPTLHRLARETALQREREARQRALLALAPKAPRPWTPALARLRRLLAPHGRRRPEQRHGACVHC